MEKAKGILITLVISFLMLPISGIFAQEEEVLPTDPDQPVVTYDEYETIDEVEPILDQTYDYDYDYESQLDSIYEATDSLSDTNATSLVALFGVFAVYIVFLLIFGLGGYIFSALALQKIGKEMNYENPVYAWIPIVNLVMIMQLGKQNPWILLALLIPGINIVATVFLFIALMEITQQRGYEKLLAVIIFIPFGSFVLLYLLAWKPKNEVITEKKSISEKSIKKE